MLPMPMTTVRDSRAGGNAGSGTPHHWFRAPAGMTFARIRRLCGTVLLAAITGACAARGPAPYSGGGGISSNQPAPAAAEPLPDLPVAQTVTPQGPTQRIEQLVTHDQSIRTVVRGLAESYGLDYQIDPDVEGTVSTSLRNVTLTEALDAIVLPHGYAYQIDGQVLRVTRSRLQTQIFALDYLSMSRMGAGTTTIQRQLGARGGAARGVGVGGAGGFAGGSGGGDIIQTVSVSDLWEEIRVSLEALVFEGTALTGGQGQAGVGAAGIIPGAGGLGGAGAPGPVSRSGEDGRRLIINPISGTIMVTASPEKLAEVAAFLSTIEGSVQRQVLIEAKIVEVSLNRRFQYGIDWNFVQQVGNLNLRLSGGQSGGQFTIAPSDGDTDRQIGIVLNVLEQQGDVSVLQSPSVRGLNNQWAVINASTDQVFFTVTRQPIIGPNGGTIGFSQEIVPEQVAIGVTLHVLPQISADNTITMIVRPAITDLVRTVEVVLEDGSRASAPVIDRRESDSVVRIRNGETVVIGGLMTTKERNSGSGIPGLRELPGIGWLFGGSTREMEKSELVIFITPRIIAGQPAAAF